MNTKTDTFDKFVAKARAKHGDKYVYFYYINSRTKIPILCPVHGIFWQSPHTHLKGHGCPKCGREQPKNKTLAQDEIIKRFRDVHGDRYNYSKVEYKGMRFKVCVICPIHGEFWITPQSHLIGHGCGKCSGRFIDREFFIEKGTIKHNGKYIYTQVGEIKGNKDIVDLICPIHGVFKQRVNDHLNGCGCPECGKNSSIENRRLDADDVIERFNIVHGKLYDYSKVREYYTGLQHPVPIGCFKHGIFWQRPDNHIQGCGCPKCTESNGEYSISVLLDNYKVQYEKQKTFDWLRYKRKQKLDFYLPELNIAIEYQGIQHFKPVFFRQYSQEKANQLYEEICRKDENKRILCEQNGIKLYYIKYTDNIEKRLDEILFELNNVKNLIN